MNLKRLDKRIVDLVDKRIVDLESENWEERFLDKINNTIREAI